MTASPLHTSRFDAICSRIVYDTTYFATMFAMTLGWSLRTAGRGNIPTTGPALVVANHQSFFDPILVGLATRRHLCSLGRKTLFRNPAFGWLIRMLNGVPIDQEGVSKEGLKQILEQLRLGQTVVIYPEGERTPHGEMQQLKPGIHLLIKRSHAPIVPVGIAGAYDAWPRWRPLPIPAPLFMPANRGCIGVSIGKPIDSRPFAEMPREKALEELFNIIHSEWQKAEQLRRQE